MKIFNKKKFAILLLVFLIQFVFLTPKKTFAITSPTLGTVDRFAILAGTAITNVPTSVITGDVGLSPAAGSNYSGLTALEVTGTIYAADATGPGGAVNNPGLLTTAKNDLITVYNRLAATDNAACTTSYVGGQDLKLVSPLVAGVYCVDAGGFTLTGNLVLEGAGVWIFRSEATIITSPGSSVTGGDPCNVWWRAETSATLDTTTSFIGNLLALTSITMNTSATLNGRALARNGAVTLDKNTITNAACATAPTPTPTSSPSSGSSSSSSSNGTSVCPSFKCTTPLIIDSRRESPTSIFLSWGPYAGTDQFLIQYGFENGKWLYNTSVTGFSTTINALPPNQPIWVLISPRNSCAIGPCGEAQFIGGPSLPNTGHGNSQKNNFSSFIALSIFIFALSSFVVIRKKRAIFSK